MWGVPNVPHETSWCHRILLKCIFKKGGVKWEAQRNHSTRGRCLFYTVKFQGQHMKNHITLKVIILITFLLFYFKGSLGIDKGVSCHGSSLGWHSVLLLNLKICTKFPTLLLLVTNSSSCVCCKGKSLLKMMETQPEKEKSECAGAATSFWHPLLAPEPGGAACQEKRSKLSELEMFWTCTGQQADKYCAPKKTPSIWLRSITTAAKLPCFARIGHKS